VADLQWKERTGGAAAYAGPGLAVLCVLAAMLAGFGHRWDWWDFRVGFSVLRWSVYVAHGALALALVGAVFTAVKRSWRVFALAIAGASIALAVIAVPWTYMRTARSVPPIHDITTDTANPPVFVALLPLRGQAPNSADYGGPAVAAQQKRGYPDIAPAIFRLAPQEVFAQAERTAREIGWNIVAAVPSEGRLEATDRTFWFGFTDDVVVRVQPVGGSTRVDVRSVSRVGRSDIGANARRIRAFLHKLSANVGP
jgi:uncharacterized protein (DUF1499 family)